MRSQPEQVRLPKLSIGVPVYNGERYLEEVLRSLLDQGYDDCEIVISDNASTDRTEEICRDYAAKDPRIRHFRNTTNIGAAPNFNRAFRLCRGAFFKWVAYDDYYAPTYLERCMGALDGAPEAVLAHTDVLLVDGAGQPLPHDPETNSFWTAAGNPVMPVEPPHLASAGAPEPRFDDILHRVNRCSAVFGVIRADVLRATGLQRSYYGADKVLLAELALRGPFVQIEDRLFHKRVHPSMSFLLSTMEKRKWIDPRVGFHIPQVLMLRDYFAMVMGSRLSVAQKRRCIGSIIRMVRRDGLWHRIFVPGPENYLGINFNFLVGKTVRRGVAHPQQHRETASLPVQPAEHPAVESDVLADRE